MIFGIREPIITTTISLLPLFGDISSSNIHLQSYLDKTRTTLFLFKKWVLWSRLNRPTAIVSLCPALITETESCTIRV